MFKIRAVVHARREHHHGGVIGGGGGAGAQGVQQHVGVMRHGCHLVLAEKIGKQPHHHLAVFKHVTHATGYPQVVFQHVILSGPLRVGGTHDVNAGDVRVNVFGHLHPRHLGPVLRVVDDEIGRHDTGAQNVLPVVHVVNEPVERRDPLHQPLLHAGPFVRRNDPGDQIKRDEPLVAGTAFVLGAIHRKGDANAPEDHLRLGPAGLHDIRGLFAQPLGIALVVIAHIAAIERQHRVHLVKFLHEQASCKQDSKLRAHPAHHTLASHHCVQRESVVSRWKLVLPVMAVAIAFASHHRRQGG